MRPTPTPPNTGAPGDAGPLAIDFDYESHTGSGPQVLLSADNHSTSAFPSPLSVSFGVVVSGPAASVLVDGRPASRDPAGRVRIDVPLPQLLSEPAVSDSDWGRAFVREVSVIATPLAGGTPARMMVRVDSREVIASQLDALFDHYAGRSVSQDRLPLGIRLPPGPATGPRSIMLRVGDARRHLGRASTFGEIDWFADFDHATSQITGQCTIPTPPEHQAGMRYTLPRQEWSGDVIVRRRDGTQVATQHFSAAGVPCPEFIPRLDDRPVPVYPDPAPIAAWLAALPVR